MLLQGAKYGFELTLVNAVTVRALKGKETDRIDAGPLAELLQYGLLAGSFVPEQAIRELRDLTHMRVQIQQDRNRVINRDGEAAGDGQLQADVAAGNIKAASAVRGRGRPAQLRSASRPRFPFLENALGERIAVGPEFHGHSDVERQLPDLLAKGEQ